MSAKDELITTLLERIEEGARRVYVAETRANDLAENRRKSGEDHAEVVRKMRREMADLRFEISRLSAPRDPEGKKAHAYDELHRMTLDVHSLIERENLTDLDKVKSIHGLIDQVVGREWFEGNPHQMPETASATTPKRRKPKAANEADAIEGTPGSE